jgi:hypothetical protein
MDPVINGFQSEFFFKITHKDTSQVAQAIFITRMSDEAVFDVFQTEFFPGNRDISGSEKITPVLK